MRCDRCEKKPCGKGNPCIETDSEELYSDPQERKLFRVSAEVEALYYGEICRLEEIMEFCRRMGYERIGGRPEERVR